MYKLAIFYRSRKKVDDTVTDRCPPVLYYVVKATGGQGGKRSIRSSQQCHNASENRGECGGTNNALVRAHGAISAFTVATPAATVRRHRVRTLAWAEPGHSLALRCKVDRSRRDRCREAGVQAGCDEDGSTPRADGGRVRGSEGHV